MRFIRLLPEAQNDYKGHKAVVVLVVLLAISSTVPALIHTFFPDGGSNVLAGLVIPGDANSAVIFTFAWAGLYQLIFTAIQWIVLIRYRKFIPLIILLLFFEYLGMFILPMVKPIAPSLITHTPPEVFKNRVLLPLTLVLFVVSLIPVPERKSKAG
jgi:hypothetical protein